MNIELTRNYIVSEADKQRQKIQHACDRIYDRSNENIDDINEIQDALYDLGILLGATMVKGNIQ